MRTIISAVVTLIAVWLRQSGIVDIDDKTAEALVVTGVLIVMIFQRLATGKTQAAAVEAGEKAESAVGQAAEGAATSAVRAERYR